MEVAQSGVASDASSVEAASKPPRLIDRVPVSSFGRSRQRQSSVPNLTCPFRHRCTITVSTLDRPQRRETGFSASSSMPIATQCAPDSVASGKASKESVDCIASAKFRGWMRRTNFYVPGLATRPQGGGVRWSSLRNKSASHCSSGQAFRRS